MKRKIVLISVAILVLICAFACLASCNKDKNKEQSDNVSRLTEAYYAGESSSFAVSVEKGRREKNFIADGTATDVVDFCEINIQPLKTNEYEKITYVLSGQDKTLSGELTGGTFGEFTASIALDFVPDKIAVTAGKEQSEIDLSSVLEGALTSQDVINIAKKEFKEKIDAEYSEGKADREIYVKLITADRTNYYYYVSFIGDGTDYWAMLVDIKTGAIVSKK